MAVTKGRIVIAPPIFIRPTLQPLAILLSLTMLRRAG
jgi:hypothetical protein